MLTELIEYLCYELHQWVVFPYYWFADGSSALDFDGLQQWSVPRGSKIESAAAPQICIIKPHPDRKQKPVENVLTEYR